MGPRRPRPAACCPILYVRTHHMDMVRLPQARRPKPAACFYMVYTVIHMHREVMAWHMQPAPGQLFAFAIFVNMHAYQDMVRLPQASRPRQAACYPIVNVCMHIYRDDGAGPGSPPWASRLFLPKFMYMHLQKYVIRLPPGRPTWQAACLFPLDMGVCTCIEMAGLASAARPGQVACFPNLYVNMLHVYRDVVTLPQASRRRQSPSCPIQLYVCIYMHKQMMGLPRQPAPDRLPAFPIDMSGHGKAAHAGRSKQAYWFLLYMYVCTCMGRCWGWPGQPAPGRLLSQFLWI